MPGATYRIHGGNDRLSQALASSLGDRVQLGCELVAVSHRGKNVRASLKRRREVAQLQTDYLVFAMPATLVRRIPMTPTLPVKQHEALNRLAYGNVTKTSLQFSERFWRAPGRPRAFGTPLPIGAAWEANEEQRGRPGILTLLAGGGASRQTQDIVSHEGVQGLVKQLDWLGWKDATLLASKQMSWEAEPWSRGGYAVFDAGFDPALREWLARPCERLFFAGEHTSIASQGYMNGAVESGRRAATEIEAAHSLQSQK
jgi:monoamine oxidase